MKKARIKKNDKVQIISGKDKGKIGKVLKVLYKTDQVLVEKVNLIKRHIKANYHKQKSSGIVEQEAPVDISNLMLLCNTCAKPTRVNYRIIHDGNKVRFCQKCNEIIV